MKHLLKTKPTGALLSKGAKQRDCLQTSAAGAELLPDSPSDDSPRFFYLRVHIDDLPVRFVLEEDTAGVFGNHLVIWTRIQAADVPIPVVEAVETKYEQHGAYVCKGEEQQGGPRPQ